MRNDEAYRPKPQSMQMEIAGLGAKGEEDYEAALRWIEENPGPSAAYLVDNAHRLSRKGYVSANYLVNMVRNELHVSVRNGLAPSFSGSWRAASRTCAAHSTSTAASPTGSSDELEGEAPRIEVSVDVPVAEVVGKQRPRHARGRGRPYTPSKTKRAEDEIRRRFKEASGGRWSSRRTCVGLHLLLARAGEDQPQVLGREDRS